MDSMAEEVPIDRDWWKIWQKRRYILSVMVCLGVVNSYSMGVSLSVAVVAMTGPSVDKPTPDFDWTPQMKGYLLSAFYYGYAAMQVPAGIILKRLPAHTYFGVAVAMSAALTALTPLVAEYFYLFLVFRLCMGMFQGATVPCILNFMANWAPPLERSRMQSICVSGAFLGTVYTLSLSGYIGAHYGWECIFYVFATTSLVWCFVWALFVRNAPDTDRWISKTELRYIETSIGCKTAEKHQIPWGDILLSVPVWSLAFANFSWGWGYSTMLLQLPTFLKEVSGFDLAQNGLLSSLPYVTMTGMSLIAGYTADRLLVRGLPITRVRKGFMSIALMLQTVFLIIAAYVLIPSVNIFCISMGIGIGAFTYAAISVNAIDLAPKFAPIIGGLSNSCGTITGIVSPVLTGYIVTAEKHDVETLKSQWQVIFLICAAIYTAGAVVYLVGGSGLTQVWATRNPRKLTNEENLEPLEG